MKNKEEVDSKEKAIGQVVSKEIADIAMIPRERKRLIKDDCKAEADGSVKITITKDAAAGLKELVQRVNEGFEAGQVHRQNIASWILSKFLASCTDQDVQSIRTSHYDDSIMLDSLCRRVKETGEVPDFLREVLRKQFGSWESNRKSKKTLSKGYISDVPIRNEDAA